MSERIDHAAEARQHIDWAHEQQSEDGRLDESVQHNATLAVAEAVLALVEQQRIANRIALAAAVAQASRAAGMHGSVLGLIVKDVGLFDNPDTPSGVPGLHDDIREGLGL